MLHQKPENVSPQGKQNVFFTCHPEDHDKYFEKIYEDIRKFSNCIVWYSTEEYDENDDITLLERMNIFVVPITTKLLLNPSCRTLKYDVPYAIQNKKPILPLMQENGLDELFYKHFSDLQYLDPNSQDPTAITYDEKLKKYLNSHLINDELALKVRSAFDAYIFLSYRKKDREYANKLMRLIHQNDFCRDIAIWYDEYLEPGENFNNAILKAIEKSELFTMVVTPNLINEDNYVKKHEYPAALHKKNILPVEMVPTDSTELIKQYPKIPNCIDGYNSIELSNALETSLFEIACRENDNDPQHNFFIGLAYLNGIDVEINHERALQLVTTAAESNQVPEAIEKLVSMYQDGHGVKRDYRIAVEWQQKLVDYWERKYFNNNTIEVFQKYFYELWNLGNQLFSINLDAAESTYNEMLKLCNKSPEKDNRYNLSVCYERLSYVCEARDNYEEAYFLYKKTFTLIEQLSKENVSIETKSNLSICLEFLGYLCEKCGNLKDAESFHLKSLSLRKEIIMLTGETETSCRLLWESYFWLGNIYEKYGHLEKAKNYYQEALIQSEKLAKETRNYIAQRNLFINYEKLGEIYKLQNNLNKAEEFYQICLDLTKELATETESVEAKRYLSISFERLGDIRMSFRQLKEAEEYYLKSFSLSKQLCEEKSPESQRDLSYSYIRLGNVNKERGDFIKAEKFYQKSLSLRERLVYKSKSLENQHNLALNYSYLGDLYKHWNNLDSAEMYYKKELLINEQLFSVCKDNVELYDHLAVSYYKIATIKEPYNRALLFQALQIYTTLELKYPSNVRYSKNKDIIEKMLE